MRLTVIGTGYLGATHAACMADLGHEVLGLDVDAAKVAMLSSGHAPFYEPGLDEVLKRGLASGRLRFTTDWAEVGAFADVHFVCVGTPQMPDSFAADVSGLDASIDALAPALTARPLIVGKSTVPVGTAMRLLLRAQQKANVDIDLAWNPEFLREGRAVRDTVEPDRIVVGVRNPEAEKRLREVYEAALSRDTPFVVTDLPTAELVKTAANSFLATKISFINAMAELCEATGADVSVLATALSYDTRIGGQFLRAGLGFGGGCLPKDIRAFMARAEELGVDQALSFLRDVDAINTRRRARTVDIAREQIGGSLSGARVAVLGAAFKPDSDDVRDSPALDVAAMAGAEGADVHVHDPRAIKPAQARHPELSYDPDVQDALRGADLVLHLTEWQEYRELDPVEVGELVAHRRILDGRNVLDPLRWRAADWNYRALGRP